MRALSGASVAMVAVLALTASGCRQINELKAMRAVKAAHQAYGAQEYARAATLYEESITDNPDLAYAYFYLGNSYDNQYKPSRKGEPDNDALLQKAVENYQIAAEKLSTSPNPEFKNLANLSLKYLVSAYNNADKLNDPARAEPVLIKMIELDPADPEGYFMLANVYEQAGVYEDAERVFLLAKDARPNSPDVYLQLAGYYNRQGMFEKTIEALRQRAEHEPKNPAAHQMIAGYYYEEVNGDTRLVEAQKRDYVQKGLESAETALQLQPDYVDGLVFKGLLLRQQALLEKDQAKIASLIKEANELSERANGLRKKQAAGGD